MRTSRAKFTGAFVLRFMWSTLMPMAASLAERSMPPNPSIERAVSSGLRPLETAAHVKR